MASKRFLVLFCAGWTSLAAAANALTENPLDPALPLDVHTRAICQGQPIFRTGNQQASCASVVVDEDPVTLTFVTGNSEVTSDLRTGTLRSRSTGRSFPLPGDSLSARASGTGELYDTITVLGSFAGTVELRMAVEGSLLVTPPATMFNIVQAQLFRITDGGLTPDSAGMRIEQAGSTSPPGARPRGTVGAQGQASFSTNADVSGFFDPSDVSFVLSIFILVTPENPSFNFVARLSTNSLVNSSGGLVESDVNFGNTAQLAVIVPEGVEWISASDALLVPEPSALVLLAAALGVAYRRARTRGVVPS